MESKKYILIIFILTIIVFCKNDYKNKRKEWALQFRGKIQSNFVGFPSIENLVKNFLLDMINNKNVDKYFLTDKEYLTIYWANQPWEKIYDKGLTIENVLYLYHLYQNKNLNLTKSYILKQNNFNLINADKIVIQIKKQEPLQNNQLIYFDSIIIISNSSKKIYPLKGLIIQHNQQYKLIQIKPEN
ncbi:MAG: hypothetical protein KatS3mg129_1414 [Leptospiraceae bacterium]|nr:MAG: hypothetical protein KatS3mg129_1414 [Leptospiraceae bacterium]